MKQILNSVKYIVALALLTFAVAQTSFAQTADDKAAAEVLFEQGKAALLAGRRLRAAGRLAARVAALGVFEVAIADSFPIN